MRKKAAMSKPKRIQRKRTKGWKMPKGAVYIGRPTKWGNPYKVGEEINAPILIEGMVVGTPEVARNLYSLWIGENGPPAELEELKGKDLACWCPLDQPCHADVLLELANNQPCHT